MYHTLCGMSSQPPAVDCHLSSAWNQGSMLPLGSQPMPWPPDWRCEPHVGDRRFDVGWL